MWCERLCVAGAGQGLDGFIEGLELQEQGIDSGDFEDFCHAFVDADERYAASRFVARDKGADKATQPGGVDVRYVGEVENHSEGVFSANRVLERR